MHDVDLARSKAAKAAARASETKREGRKRAFANLLRSHLNEALTDEVSPPARDALVRALTDAYGESAHDVDMRSILPFGKRRYFVLQAGFAPRASFGPLASRVFNRLSPKTLDDFTSAERAVIADCVERSEITARHPIDWRPRFRMGAIALYLNFIAGVDKRGDRVSIYRDRRAPTTEPIGVAIFFLFVAAIAVFGAMMFVSVCVTLFDVLSDPASRKELISIIRQ